MRYPFLPISIVLGCFVAGCGGEEELPPIEPATHSVDFAGFVYDGASGTRLTSYPITVAVRDAVIGGSVDATGRFALGPISAWRDYSVVIEAEGYRFFRSNNAGVELPDSLAGSEDIGNYSTHQTLHYDAYLFPTDLLAPAATLSIRLDTSTELPSGKLRLRPVSPSLLADDSNETPAGVSGQLWTNDEDLQAQTITADFSNGTFELAAGQLVYGVSYQVAIYDVDGYQPFTGTFIAGLEADKTFTLQEELQEPLLLESSTASTCAPPTSPIVASSAVVLLTFNRPLEFGMSTYPGGHLEALDDGLSISSFDFDNDMMFNVLYADSSAATQLRGVTATIVGNTLELSWSPSAGLMQNDPSDPITSVQYGNLVYVLVQPVGRPTQSVSLSSLVGSSISCL